MMLPKSPQVEVNTYSNKTDVIFKPLQLRVFHPSLTDQHAAMVLKYLYQLHEHMHRPKTSTKKGICKAISAAKSGLKGKLVVLSVEMARWVLVKGILEILKLYRGNLWFTLEARNSFLAMKNSWWKEGPELLSGMLLHFPRPKHHNQNHTSKSIILWSYLVLLVACRPMCKIAIAHPMQTVDVIPSSCKICGRADCNSMQATKILRSATRCCGSYDRPTSTLWQRHLRHKAPSISTVKAIQRSVL